MHDDCYEALNWAVSREIVTTYRIDPTRMGLWGCSAGAHLGATVLLWDAREHNPSRIRQASLVIPAVCHPDAFNGHLKEVFEKRKQTYLKETPSAFFGHIENLFGNPPLVSYIYSSFSRSHARFSAAIITTPPLTPTNPLVSPLLSPSLPLHHPPTHITVAGCDILCDQGIAYAMRLRDAGIDTALEVVPGVPHVFTWIAKSKATIQWTRGQIKVFNAAFEGHASSVVHTD